MVVSGITLKGVGVMPREIINEIDVTSKPDEVVSQAVLAWGWDLSNGNCAALLNINTRLNGQWQGTAVALEWGDLERLNKSVRRAMKHYQKAPAASVLPAVGDDAEMSHKGNVSEVHQISA